MAQRYERNRQQILEGKLEKLFGEYAAMSLMIDLAQILSEEKVAVRIYGDTIRFTYEDGETFYLEDEDLIMLCGLDSETIEFVKESVNDHTDAA
jgi:hypothetical protein